MSEFNSFYGGRQGAPFIVKKRFDAISMEALKAILTRKGVISYYSDNNYYVGKNYAVEKDDNGNVTYILVKKDDNDEDSLITKNLENAEGYKFSYIKLDGKSYVNIKRVTQEKYEYDTTQKKYVFSYEAELVSKAYTVPIEKFETMEEYFSTGTETTSEVGYGEYVIIDSILNLNDKKNIDNGKIYIRGFEGAEYIGQITGPEGETLDITLSAYDDARLSNSTPISLKLNSGLVPGAKVTINTDGSHSYSDKKDGISYKHTILQDEEGNSAGLLVGLEIPYNVIDFNITNTSAYADAAFVLDKQNSTPFLTSYNMTLPMGKHGANLENVRIEPTKARIGATYYKKTDFSEVGGTLTSETTLDGFYKGDSTNSPYGIIKISGVEYYLKIDDLFLFKFLYTIRNFESKEAGETGTPNDFTISDYNLKSIKEVNIKEEKFTYNSSTGIWSSDKDDNTSKIKIDFDDGNSSYISRPLNGIKEMAITDPNEYKSTGSNKIKYKHLLVLYDDPALRGNDITYKSDLITDASGHKGYVAGWKDLGPTNFTNDTLKVKLTIPDTTTISSINDITPEKISINASGAVVAGTEDTHYCGWVICQNALDTDGEPILDEDTGKNIVNFYYYDYPNKKWVLIGCLNEGLINPTTIVQIGDDNSSAESLNVNGLFFDLETVYFAK